MKKKKEKKLLSKSIDREMEVIGKRSRHENLRWVTRSGFLSKVMSRCERKRWLRERRNSRSLGAAPSFASHFPDPLLDIFRCFDNNAIRIKRWLQLSSVHLHGACNRELMFIYRAREASKICRAFEKACRLSVPKLRGEKNGTHIAEKLGSRVPQKSEENREDSKR